MKINQSQNVLIIRSANENVLSQAVKYLSEKQLNIEVLSNKKHDNHLINIVYSDLKIETNKISSEICNNKCFSKYKIVILYDPKRYSLVQYQKFIDFALLLNLDILFFSQEKKLHGLTVAKYLAFKNKKLSLKDFSTNIIIIFVICSILKIASYIYPVKIVFIFESRIGHLLGNTETYLRRLKVNKKREFPIFVYSNVCNKTYIEILKNKYLVIKSKYLKKLFKQEQVLSKYVRVIKHKDPETLNFHEVHDNKINISPSLCFSKTQKKKGRDLLNKLNINENNWFICVHSRDGEYLKKSKPNQDCLYHNYRDCKIENFIKAAEFIFNQGGCAIRMGHYISDDQTCKEFMIDYAKNLRTDFGDIFLPAHAKFFLGNTAGLINAAAIFNVPLALTNMIPLEYSPRGKNDLYIVKKIWSRAKKRLLTFSEILDCGYGRFLRSTEYAENNLEVIENTEEEILNLAIEMYQRLEGIWTETEENKVLQQKFKAIFNKQHLNYGFQSKIGADFLKQNQELL